MHTKFWYGNLIGRDHLDDLSNYVVLTVIKPRMIKWTGNVPCMKVKKCTVFKSFGEKTWRKHFGGDQDWRGLQYLVRSLLAHWSPSSSNHRRRRRWESVSWDSEVATSLLNCILLNFMYWWNGWFHQEWVATLSLGGSYRGKVSFIFYCWIIWWDLTQWLVG